MLANTKEVAKAAANYRAMHPILRREIAEYSRGMASAYALEQTTRRRWYQFTCSSTHPVSGPIYSVSQKADCNVKRKESRERESQETCEGKDGTKQDIIFLVFPAHRKIGQTQSTCNGGLLRCISRKLKKRSARNSENKRNVLMSSKKGQAKKNGAQFPMQLCL